MTDSYSSGVLSSHCDFISLVMVRYNMHKLEHDENVCFVNSRV